MERNRQYPAAGREDRGVLQRPIIIGRKEAGSGTIDGQYRGGRGSVPSSPRTARPSVNFSFWHEEVTQCQSAETTEPIFVNFSQFFYESNH